MNGTIDLSMGFERGKMCMWEIRIEPLDPTSFVLAEDLQLEDLSILQVAQIHRTYVLCWIIACTAKS